MQTAVFVARHLLGLLFTAFALNGFHHFIHRSLPPNLLAMQFLIAVSASHFAAFFFAMQALGGALLLSRFGIFARSLRRGHDSPPSVHE